MIDRRLEQIVQDVIGEDVRLTPQTRAADVPGWDSLAHINIMFAVETEYGVSFTDEQLTAFSDVGQLQDYLTEHQSS